MRRILALATAASFLPFAALADDIGAGRDIVVEEEPETVVKEVIKETVVEREKPVSLPPPGWRPPKSDQGSKR
jgi:hypothetical protein